MDQNEDPTGLGFTTRTAEYVPVNRSEKVRRRQLCRSEHSIMRIKNIHSQDPIFQESQKKLFLNFKKIC